MARMLRVYVGGARGLKREDFFGKELVKNAEPAWPGTHHVDFELAQFVEREPFKIDMLSAIGGTQDVLAGSITVRRSEVPRLALKEYPMQINEDALIVRDDYDTLTFWSNNLVMVRNAFMSAISEHYVEPKKMTWAEFEKC